jgi:DNA-binding GntR family transcriptional regulator
MSKSSTVDAAPTESTPARLSERVYEALVEMIVTGQLGPGRAISELALSRQLNVSRTPIHEAIKQLVKDGLISQSANRRPVVVSFGSDDIFDVYEMRRILETEAAAKAAQRIDLPTLNQLERELHTFRDDFDQPAAIERWVGLDDRFHSTIAAASGSHRLAADITRYRRLHRVFNRSHTQAAVLTQAIQEHQGILDALRSRDIGAAREAMGKHLQEWQRFFVNHLK